MANRVPQMLKVLSLCFLSIVIISFIMVWRGPEPPIVVQEGLELDKILSQIDLRETEKSVLRDTDKTQTEFLEVLRNSERDTLKS